MDVGSTFVKYLVSDEVGNVVLDEKVPFPKPFNEIEFIISRSEIDEVIKVIMKKAAALDCGCAFISVQMHGYILQYQTGEFSDYFSWRSGGGDTESAALKSIDFSVRGTSLKGNLPIAKLYRLKHELDGTQFYTLGSYIAYLLTGNNITHKTDACASGFYNADGSVAEKNFIKGLSLPNVCDNVE